MRRANGTTALLGKVVFPFALLCWVCGCRSHCDLVEAELRFREGEMRRLQNDLQRAELMNLALENELRHRTFPAAPPPGVVIPVVPGGPVLPGAPAGPPVGIPPPRVSESGSAPAAPAIAPSWVKEVSLARGTGGVDDDSWPGDEALMVVLVPRDHDGSALKADGSLAVTAYEVTAEGLKVPLSSWEVPALNLRRTWREGLLSTGYFVTLPWKRPPCSEKLRVVAHFRLIDGRVFEADRDVTIRLVPGSPRVRPAPGMVPPPAVTETEVLPTPAEGPPLSPEARKPAASIQAVRAARPEPPVKLARPGPRDQP
jgi:hypothetical protein